MRIREFISKYDNSNISNFEYDDILNDIYESTIGRPIPKVFLFKNELIERIRNNYNGEIFRSIEDVSLRTDLKNITKYGRVNKPRQSNFYGTLADDNIDLARITTVIETNKTLRDKHIQTREQQIFTTSQWLVKDSIEILIMPFHPNSTNKRMNAAAEHFRSAIKYDFGNLSTEFLELLHFFSHHFGKEITNHLEYKLTSAFGDVFMQEYGLDGILYPSIKSDFQAQNIVLSPKAVNKLELFQVGMFELFINNDQVYIDPVAYAKNLGENKNNFEWVNVERTSKETIESIIRAK